jgi:hypothetical protein
MKFRKGESGNPGGRPKQSFAQTGPCSHTMLPMRYPIAVLWEAICLDCNLMYWFYWYSWAGTAVSQLSP